MAEKCDLSENLLLIMIMILVITKSLYICLYIHNVLDPCLVNYFELSLTEDIFKVAEPNFNNADMESIDSIWHDVLYIFAHEV